MPMRRDISFEELERIAKGMRKNPTMKVEDIRKAVEEGRKLTLEESAFSDPGPDYSAVYLEGVPTSILYIPGY